MIADIDMTTLIVMSQPQRRAKGAAKDAEAIYARVDPDARAKFDQMRDALGVSQVRLLTEVLRRVETDERGRPVWWPHEQQQELPLKSA
ncbi:MAG TPA: hypothetical protein VIP77_20080 [Jiangellaceae bacterium]